MSTNTHITLSDDTMTAVFDGRTGALIKLRHHELGWNLVEAHDGGLSFGLSVPRPGRRVAKVEGLEQGAPQIDSGADAVSFRWSGMVDDEGCQLAIEVEARARLADGFLLFDAIVKNDSDRTIEMVAWPQLHAIQPLEKQGRIRQMEAGYGLWGRQISPLQTGWGGYWGQHQPETSGPWSRATFFLLQTEAPENTTSPGGWYVGLHESRRRRLVCYAAEHRPGTLDSYSLIMSEETVNGRQPGVDYVQRHMSFIAPGDTLDTAPIALSPYAGDWQAGADRYRAWRKTWFRHPKRPAWVEDVHSWLQIQIFGAEDEMNFRYTDLPEIARDCTKYGIKAIQLTGWAEGGQDRGNPSHDIEPALGTREELVP